MNYSKHYCNITNLICLCRSGLTKRQKCWRRGWRHSERATGVRSKVITISKTEQMLTWRIAGGRWKIWKWFKYAIALVLFFSFLYIVFCTYQKRLSWPEQSSLNLVVKELSLCQMAWRTFSVHSFTADLNVETNILFTERVIC